MLGHKRRRLGRVLMVLAGGAALAVGASAFVRLGVEGCVYDNNAEVELDRGLFSVFFAGKARATRKEAGLICELVKAPSFALMLPDQSSRRETVKRNMYGSVDLGRAGMAYWWSPDPARPIDLRYAHGGGMTVPAWPWPVVLAGAGYGLLAWGKRAAKGRCRKCGYDLAGLAKGAACPECGRVGG